MGTRSVIEFAHKDKVLAYIYRHWDGYPSRDGMPCSLLEFFLELEANVEDRRFDDPQYLAAKFVVWQAKVYAKRFDYKSGKDKPTHYLDFLGVGITTGAESAHPDIEFVYRVDCNGSDENGMPLIRWRHVHEEKDCRNDYEWHDIEYERTKAGGICYQLGVKVYEEEDEGKKDEWIEVLPAEKE